MNRKKKKNKIKCKASKDAKGNGTCIFPLFSKQLWLLRVNSSSFTITISNTVSASGNIEIFFLFILSLQKDKHTLFQKLFCTKVWISWTVSLHWFLLLTPPTKQQHGMINQTCTYNRNTLKVSTSSPSSQWIL